MRKYTTTVEYCGIRNVLKPKEKHEYKDLKQYEIMRKETIEALLTQAVILYPESGEGIEYIMKTINREGGEKQNGR